MNKIPKVIHYCWFGGNDLDEKSLHCIESWKKIMPDYEIKRWDESNYDVYKHPFIKEAYENKKWAFVSDFARLDIIYNEGGIYLDTDVEVIKKFDELLECDCFMGFEAGMHVATGLGFGAVKNNEFIYENLRAYDNIKLFLADGKMNIVNCPLITTNLLVKKGLLKNNSFQQIGTVSVFPSDYFCPLEYETGNLLVTNNTYSIHLYNMTWLSDNEKKIHLFQQKMSRIFGKKISYIITSIVNKLIKIKNSIFGGRK